MYRGRKRGPAAPGVQAVRPAGRRAGGGAPGGDDRGRRAAHGPPPGDSGLWPGGDPYFRRQPGGGGAGRGTGAAGHDPGGTAGYGDHHRRGIYEVRR